MGASLSDEIIRRIMRSVLICKGAATIANFQLLCKRISTAIVGIGKQTLTICEENLEHFSINGIKPNISLQKAHDSLASVADLYAKNVLYCIQFHIAFARCCIRNLYLYEQADIKHLGKPSRSKIYALLLKSKRFVLVKYVDNWAAQRHAVKKAFVDLVEKNSSTLLTLECREKFHAYSHAECNLKHLILREYSIISRNPRPGLRCKYLTFSQANYFNDESCDSAALRHDDWLECMIQDTGAERIDFTEIGAQHESKILDHILSFSDHYCLEKVKKFSISGTNVLDLLTTDQKTTLLPILPNLS
jgi:hypothetical protein